MAGNAEATRGRLIEAARTEFARYGIAGARVDRIAIAARSNKAQIYHYFGSKDALFDAVFNQVIADVLRQAPIDPLDLPGYAGALFDGYEKHPDIARLATWYRLERADTQAPLEAALASNADKVAAIAQAQRAGDLPQRFAAADLLGLVITIAAMWTAMTPEYSAVNRTDLAHRRAVVVGAVATLIAS